MEEYEAAFIGFIRSDTDDVITAIPDDTKLPEKQVRCLRRDKNAPKAYLQPSSADLIQFR